MAKNTSPAPSTPSVSYTVAATDQSKSYNKFGPIEPIEGDSWPLLIGRGGMVYLHKSLEVSKGKIVTITITSE